MSAIAPPTSHAIWAKCLVMLAKMREQVACIDDGQFPTKTTGLAKSALQKAMALMAAAPQRWGPSPVVFHRQLIALRHLIDDVAQSSCYHISWPVVSYCDQVWGRLFAQQGLRVFFSQGDLHNYGIFPFSDCVRHCLADIVPISEQSDIQEGIYCLRMASLEEDNIPLYANTGHEFGHVCYRQDIEALGSAYKETVGEVVSDLNNGIQAQSASHEKGDIAKRRRQKAAAVMANFAKELVADAAGALLWGPSFYLSLDEMAWGSDSCAWHVQLAPVLQQIRAYPSFAFRKSCLPIAIDNLEDFAHALQDECVALNTHIKDYSGDRFSQLELGSQSLIVAPENDADSKFLQAELTKKVDSIQEALRAFSHKACEQLKKRLSSALPRTNPRSVAHLLLRLEHKITPNIVPDDNDPILGKPGEFVDILLAASLYRSRLLSSPGGSAVVPSPDVVADLDRVERLTKKAFEVSYIQREFNARKNAAGKNDVSPT